MFLSDDTPWLRQQHRQLVSRVLTLMDKFASTSTPLTFCIVRVEEVMPNAIVNESRYYSVRSFEAARTWLGTLPPSNAPEVVTPPSDDELASKRLARAFLFSGAVEITNTRNETLPFANVMIQSGLKILSDGEMAAYRNSVHFAQGQSEWLTASPSPFAWGGVKKVVEVEDDEDCWAAVAPPQKRLRSGEPKQKAPETTATTSSASTQDSDGEAMQIGRVRPQRAAAVLAAAAIASSGGGGGGSRASGKVVGGRR
jgi:hypothetical protein